jgi:FkbM family methyltransferase
LPAVQRRLIIDVGMSEGNDTEFYLRKGFSVVGVEADPLMHAHLERRFASEIADGRLTLLNRAASDVSGRPVRFWHDNRDQGHSSVAAADAGARDVTEFLIPSIDWKELRAIAGVPYYLKIDIEGGEPQFLASMAGSSSLPTYISAELQTFRPIEMFHELGYRHFRLVNQTLFHGVHLPNPSLEGNYVGDPERHHWSGPFGLELPGHRWFDFDGIRALHRTIHELWMEGSLIAGWFDCHAWMPES